ncbi:MAG: hypothetical protein ACOZJZ_04295 [Pseudomonadota bacterium]
MSRILRSFVLWLLVAALPLQGYAASSMVGCGPSHERMATALAQLPSEHEAMPHHAAAPQDGAVDAATDGSTVEKLAQFGQFKCSACAACCAAAALPAGDWSLTLPQLPPGMLAPAVGTRIASLALDGPERPPRIFLA